jgi:hypothetical protein
VKDNSPSKKGSLKISAIGCTKFVSGTNDDAALSKAQAKAASSYIRSLGVKSSSSTSAAGVSQIKSNLARQIVLAVSWK